jgi:predicted transcriptional regulator
MGEITMSKKVKDLMVPLAEYPVVDEDTTLQDALTALDKSQANVQPGQGRHRAILVRDRRGEIKGKIHYFAFLRALVPERKAMGEQALMDRAGVWDDMRDSSMRMLDLLTGDLMNVCERARNVVARDICSPTTTPIEEEAPLSEAIPAFLKAQSQSLLVTRRGITVGVLRLSDLFDELSGQIKRGDCT